MDDQAGQRRALAAVNRRLPAGTKVAVHPGNGHRPEAHWLGAIVEHHDNGIGGPLGITDVQCTDPRGFLNQRPGHITTVETKTLRVVQAADEPFQGELFAAASAKPDHPAS